MTGLLEDKGLLATQPETQEFIDEAWEHAGGDTLEAIKYIANLDEADTAEARGDV